MGMVICGHCGGDHASNRCPTYPQFCMGCYEEHPFGTRCYTWSAPLEDTSEIDAQIAREEAEKAESREEVRSKEYARVKGWREANPEEYRAYMRRYMREYRRKKSSAPRGKD